MFATRIHLLALFLVLIGLFVIFRMIQKGWLREKYALIWLFCGFISVLITAWPGLLVHICEFLQVAVPLNFLLFSAVVFLGGISLMLSHIASGQSARLEILGKELALLRQETLKLKSSFLVIEQNRQEKKLSTSQNKNSGNPQNGSVPL